MKSVYIIQYIVRILVETWLFWAWLKQPRLNHDQNKHVQNGGWMQRGVDCPKEPKLGLLWGQMSSWNMDRWRNTKAIAAKLNDNGCKRTASQCKTKLHNLKLKYKKAKLRNNTSGQSRNACPFFEELDAVLDTKPSIAPKLILEGSVQLQAASILNA